MEALCFAGNDGGNDGATYEQGCGATPHAIGEPSRSIKNPYVDVGSCVALQAGYEPMTFESPCKIADCIGFGNKLFKRYLEATEHTQ